MGWWRDAGGWKRAGAITTTLLGSGIILSSVIGFGLTAATEIGPVASDAELEAEVGVLEADVADVEAKVDTALDSVEQVENQSRTRDDSLRRDVRAILWMLCHDRSPDHQRCRGLENP